MNRPAIILIAIVSVISCNKFDDTDIWNAINENSQRISKLEQQLQLMNSDIKDLQTIVNALQEKDFVTNVSPLADGTGYTIAFSKSGSIVIKNGLSGHSPVVSVALGPDGLYYWTLDGEFIKDQQGNNILAQGRNGHDATDGTNGITPQFKIDGGYWYISYDEKKTWTQLGKASGEDGYSLFKSVEVNDGYVTLVLSDSNNTEIMLPLISDTLILNIDEGEALNTITTIEKIRGAKSLIVNGVLSHADWLYIYNNAINATTIDLSGCTWDSYIITSYFYSGVTNPYESRALTKFSLPKNCTRCELFGFQYAKEFEFSTMTTEFEGAIYYFNSASSGYYSYSYKADRSTCGNKITISIKEGIETIPCRLNPNDDMELLIFPSSIKSVSELCMCCYQRADPDVRADVVCKSIVPPSLVVDTETPLEQIGAFYTTQTNNLTYISGAVINASLYVPTESLEAYKAAPGWKQFTNILAIEE